MNSANKNGLMAGSTPPIGCFPLNARVLTPTGFVPIGQLTKGDLVMSCTKDGTLGARRITRVLDKEPVALVVAKFESGKYSPPSTLSHSFKTLRGWLSMEKLKKGDVLIRLDGEDVVNEVAPFGQPEPVRNLYTENEHNFIVDGYVVHNFTHFRQLRVFFHKVFFDSIGSVGSFDGVAVTQ
jgi:hypothetical protein